MESFNELIQKRRSTRQFTAEAVSQQHACSIMEVALMSPSGKSINPWEFILIEDKEMLQKLSESKNAGAALVAGAPMAVVVVADITKTDVWVEDCSIATIYMQLAAEDLGLGSCWVQIRERCAKDGKPSDEIVRSLLNIPDNYQVLSIVAIGHKEKERKPYDTDNLQWDKVHIGQYGAERE